jgi:hypothetical protein
MRGPDEKAERTGHHKAEPLGRGDAHHDVHGG